MDRLNTVNNGEHECGQIFHRKWNNDLIATEKCVYIIIIITVGVVVVKNKTAIISFGHDIFIDGETTYYTIKRKMQRLR